MSKELVISSNHHETRVAILEDDQLVEIYFQRAHEYSLAGSIHKGRVTRVLPGMQSAFVDLGLDRDTFLYVSDFFEEHGEDFDRVEEHPSSRRESPRPEPFKQDIAAARSEPARVTPNPIAQTAETATEITDVPDAELPPVATDGRTEESDTATGAAGGRVGGGPGD